MNKKKAVIVHSGGMDSSICLALAKQEFGANQILSLSFSYRQRHSPELIQAAKICHDWKIDHVVLNIDCLKEITSSALMNSSIPIEHIDQQPPNTLVVGRNGLMAHLGGIHAHHLGAHYVYMGIMELEGANSGYRDCSRFYMDLQQQVLRLDLDDPIFEIRTPLIRLMKKDTLEIAYQLGVLSYLLEETITCYEGIRYQGCQTCPACQLRNRGIEEFIQEYSNVSIPYLLG
jgi:7-cyano-7-deazaguanine synthase